MSIFALMDGHLLSVFHGNGFVDMCKNGLYKLTTMPTIQKGSVALLVADSCWHRSISYNDTDPEPTGGGR